MIDAHMTGIKDLDHALSELPKAVAAGVLRVALKKAGQPVADAAAVLANAHDKTGLFARSFLVSTTLSKRQRRRRGKKKDEAVLFIGSTDRKAHLIEFGTAPHLIQPLVSTVLASSEAVYGPAVAHPGTPARPTLRPAWDAQREMVLTTIGQEMWKALEKARKRLAKQDAKRAAKGL